MLNPYITTVANSIQQSYVQDLIERMTARQEEIIKAREYYDGVHYTQLTNRTREFLRVGRDATFNANYCPMVVNSKADRLKVTGFSCEDESQVDTLWRWWKRNRMDAKQNTVHRACGRDGDAYILVEWDAVADMPRFYFEPAFAGNGVMVYYSDERRDEIEYASKQWQIKHGASTGKKRRLNLYFADRIEKYVSHSDISGGHWMPYLDDENALALDGRLGQAGVVWMTDNGQENGLPLGIPIVHFKNNAVSDSFGVSDLSNVMPIQDAVNKALVDLLANMDIAGFGLLAGYGTEAWADIQLAPGSIAAVNKGYNEARLERLLGESPQGLLAAYNAMVAEIFRVSGTPVSYAQLSGQVAAEGTLKQQEITLIARVEKAQTDHGNGWEDVMNVARRLHNAYSPEPELDDDAVIETIWDQAETRNEFEQVQTLAIKVEQLGVSKEQAQRELGYTNDEIAKNQRAELRQLAMNFRNTLPNTARPSAASDNADDTTLTATENESADDDATGTAAA